MTQKLYPCRYVKQLSQKSSAFAIKESKERFVEKCQKNEERLDQKTSTGFIKESLINTGTPDPLGESLINRRKA